MTPAADLEARLVAALRADPRVMAVLTAMRALDLPDWRLFSGAVYQAAWNAVTGRPPGYGVKDYDIGFFDPDLSWEAEDHCIKPAAAALPPPLDAMAELRNQARVHLWFPQRFPGEDYPPLPCTDAALERFLCPAFAVGVRLEADDAITVAAPFGLEDVFALRLRPNPRRPFRPESFARVAANARSRWPELVVEAPASTEA